MSIVPDCHERIIRAKISYTPRHVNFEAATTLLTGEHVVPTVGDLVLAQVDKIGQHAALQLTTGRRANLFPGDEIVVCYGHRYAPDQFKAEVPRTLSPCHLVAAGGIAAWALSWHANMKSPTAIIPVGLLADANGQRINLSGAGLAKHYYLYNSPHIVAVVGTAMNAGKTTTAANLIHGLTNAGLKVGAAKVTGTGSGNDIWFMRDAGAKLALDFTDAGFPSTYRATVAQVENIFITLISHLAKAGMDVIVVEVADGLYQAETAALLQSPLFAKAVNNVIFAAADAMGATAGVEWLQRKGLPLLAVSGLLTASPLAITEAGAATGLPVLTKNMLRNAAIATELGMYSSVARSA